MKNLHKGLFKYYITHLKGGRVNCGCEEDVRKKSSLINEFFILKTNEKAECGKIWHKFGQGENGVR